MNASLKLAIAAGVKWETANLPQRPASELVIEVYDRERAALERYLCGTGTDPDAARDVVHDAFLKLHEHLIGGGDRSNLRAWLYRVAHNQAQNRRRSAVVRRSADLLAVITNAEPAATAPSPEQALLGRERQQRIRRAVASLTSVQQNCLTLRAQGFRYREIGDILQLSTSGVADTVQRAIQKVREML
jgi:RNA polymerase sigma-70 factor, ECF subfamily